MSGNDATCTGSGKSGGLKALECACKTVTQVLALIGDAGAPSPTINLNDVGVDSAETFPITLPAGTTIAGSTNQTILRLPATYASEGGAGFMVPNGGCTLQNFTLDINMSTGNGLTISGANASVMDMTVENGAGFGAEVTGGSAAFAGDDFTDNMVGLQIDGSASVTITGSLMSPTHFDGNATGIHVGANAQLALTGTSSSMLAAMGSGTVTANGNTVAGLSVSQTATDAGSPPAVSVVGLVAHLNSGATGAGILVTTPSSLYLRNSYLLDNVYGVLIQAGSSGNSVMNVDLGSTTTQGLNTLQDNTNVGLCMRGIMMNQTLLAEGNIFGGGNCSTTSAVLVEDDTCGPNGADFGVDASAGSSIDLEQCQ